MHRLIELTDGKEVLAMYLLVRFDNVYMHLWYKCVCVCVCVHACVCACVHACMCCVCALLHAMHSLKSLSVRKVPDAMAKAESSLWHGASREAVEVKVQVREETLEQLFSQRGKAVTNSSAASKKVNAHP